MPDTFEMLQELLEQQQFEILTEEKNGDGNLRLVYLMNDAVESFLIFRNAVLTGNYQENYEGPIRASLSQEKNKYILVVWQGENVVTIFFQKLDLEVHLYNYGEIGHFWVPGYEYLRQLEYRLAIARDKLEYLGGSFCTPEEQKLVQLTDFPPLNYSCYPAVPRQYIVPMESPWTPTEEAFQVMRELAGEAQDKSMLRLLGLYHHFPWKIMARIVAAALHRKKHQSLIWLLTDKIKKEASTYENRSFEAHTQEKMQRLLEKAQKLKDQLAEQGIRCEVLREEPFTTARDNLDFQIYLMVWKQVHRDMKVEIKRLEEKKQ